MARNEVMEFAEEPRRQRFPSSVYSRGGEPDPLYSLANERTYVAWLRLAVTILTAAIAIDRLFLEHRRGSTETLCLVLVLFGAACAVLGARRWWVGERALRLREPLPGFGPALLATAAVVLLGAGVVVLVITGT